MRKNMNKRFGFGKVKAMVAAAAVAACLGGASAANAARIDLTPFGSSASPTGVDVWVDVVDAGSNFKFIFHNDSTAGSVTGVYFEIDYRDWSVFQQGNRSANGSTGVAFRAGTSTSLDGDWQGNAFSYGSYSTNSGINDSSEFLTVTVKKANNGLGVDDLLPLLSSTGTRIGAYLDNPGSDLGLASPTDEPLARIELFSVSNIEFNPEPEGPGNQNPTAAPLPAAIWPGVALLGGVLLRRRRSEEA